MDYIDLDQLAKNILIDFDQLTIIRDVWYIDLDQPHIDIDQLQNSLYLFFDKAVYSSYTTETCNTAMERKFIQILELQSTVKPAKIAFSVKYYFNKFGPKLSILSSF